MTMKLSTTKDAASRRIGSVVVVASAIMQDWAATFHSSLVMMPSLFKSIRRKLQALNRRTLWLVQTAACNSSGVIM